jgi:sec-independent protein translocase protein TatA
MGLFQNLTGWHAIIILAAILLLFGATRLPALAKSVGQSMNIFKTELRDVAGPAPASSTGPGTVAAGGTAPVGATAAAGGTAPAGATVAAGGTAPVGASASADASAPVGVSAASVRG